MGFFSSIFGSQDASSKSTSTNTTSNTTETTNRLNNLTTDNGGVGLNAENSTVLFTTSDQGALSAGAALAARSLDVASAANDYLAAAGAQLGSTALSMVDHSNNLAATLSAGSNAVASNMFNGVLGLMGDVLKNDQQTIQIASTMATTPTRAQDPNRYLIAGGLAMVAIVAFMAVKGK